MEINPNMSDVSNMRREFPDMLESGVERMKLSDAEPGDVIAFILPQKGGAPDEMYHFALYLGDGLVIHKPGGLPLEVTSYEDVYARYEITTRSGAAEGEDARVYDFRVLGGQVRIFGPPEDF